MKQVAAWQSCLGAELVVASSIFPGFSVASESARCSGSAGGCTPFVLLV